MECLLVFMVLTGLIVFLVIVASGAQARSERRNRGFQNVAQRYGGAFNRAGLFGRPSARFHYGQTYCLLNTVSISGGGIYTQLRIQWPDPKLRIELVSCRTDRMAGRRLMRGLSEMQLDDTNFNLRYLVRTNDPVNTRTLFSEGVRWQIERLRAQFGSDELYLYLNRGGLLIQKPGFIRDPQNLDDFVRFGLELYDQAMLTKSEGVEFVDESSVKLIEEVICQICGEEIHADMIFCIRCKTPHCKDCWEYNGQCSTYGCGETRFFAPMVANPRDDHDPLK